MTTATDVRLPAGAQVRVFDADLEIVTRAKGGDGRTIRGIAVPWERWIDVYGDGWLYESFRSGVADHQQNALNRIKLSNRHMYRGGEPIGVTTLLRNDTKGLYWEARRSNTQSAQDAFELGADGVLDQLSVGFRERPGGNEFANDPLTGKPSKNRVIRVKVDLFEVAMVPEGAYGDGATVEGFRSADPNQRVLPVDRDQQVRDALRGLGFSEDEIERRWFGNQVGSAPAPSDPDAELLAALAALPDAAARGWK